MKKLFLLILVLLLSLTGCQKPNKVVDDNKEFDGFLYSEFQALLNDDLISQHYQVYNPETYQLLRPEVASLGEVSYESYQEQVEKTDALIAKFKEFKYDSLSSRQKVDYDVIMWNLNATKELNKYPDFDFVFSPMNGYQSNIITNFMEFRIENKQDIEDYLWLLKDVSRLFKDGIVFTKQQAEKGYFLQDYTLDETIDLIDKFTDAKDNQLIVSFKDKVALVNDISEEEKSAFLQENEEIVYSQIIPVFKETKEALNGLRGSSSIKDQGLAAYPNGKEYYATLFKYKASDDISVDDAFKALNDYILSWLQQYIVILSGAEGAVDEASNYTLPYKGVDEILAYLEEHYPKIVHPLPSIDYKISYLDPSITNPSISAYYLQAPIDNTKLNVIRVNGENSSSDFDLFVTLAHEGLPGHLYQNMNFIQTEANPYRLSNSFIGYSEGWAMISEFFMIETLDFEYPETATILKSDIGLNYAIGALVDIMVNYYGYDVAQIEEHFSTTFGFNLGTETFQAIREGAISDPASIIPYGYGLMKMDNYYNEALKKYGDKFSIIEFTEVLMKNGERPFVFVDKDIAQYMKGKK